MSFLFYHYCKFNIPQDAVKVPENVNKTTEVKDSNTSVSLTFSSTSGHVDFAKSHKAPDKMLPDSKKITSFAPAKTSKEKTKSNQPQVIFIGFLNIIENFGLLTLKKQSIC